MLYEVAGTRTGPWGWYVTTMLKCTCRERTRFRWEVPGIPWRSCPSRGTSRTSPVRGGDALGREMKVSHRVAPLSSFQGFRGDVGREGGQGPPQRSRSHHEQARMIVRGDRLSVAMGVEGSTIPDFTGLFSRPLSSLTSPGLSPCPPLFWPRSDDLPTPLSQPGQPPWVP